MRKACHHDWSGSPEGDTCTPDGRNCVMLTETQRVVCHHTGFRGPCNHEPACKIDGAHCLVLEKDRAVGCHHFAFLFVGGPGQCDCTTVDGSNVKIIETPGGLIDEILPIVRSRPGYENVTYYATDGNKFTPLDTPRLWGKGAAAAARDMPEACSTLLELIEDVIGNAERHVDITTLFNTELKYFGLPDGGFQNAISRGFKRLSDAKRMPLVRILSGNPVPTLLIEPATIENWLKKTISLHQRPEDVQFPIRVGLNHGSKGSWNHAKIIAADDSRAIVGGHNLWSDVYLQHAPVHDVSGLFEGPAVKGARNFCDYLWHHRPSSFLLVKGKIYDSTVNFGLKEPPSVPPRPMGTSRMLSLGRLGNLADFSLSTNASVTARVVALCRAKSKIRISQQSLEGLNGVTWWRYDFYTCLAIVRAMQAGVDVEIVVSNEVKNYGGSAPAVLDFLKDMYVADVCKTIRQYVNVPSRDKVHAWAALLEYPPSQRENLRGPGPDAKRIAEVVQQFNSKLKLATLHFSENTDHWEYGSKLVKREPAANHAKVYIIDEDCFYVGSDNFYNSLDKRGLQEFGYLVEGRNETREFIANYWEKLWSYSGKKALTAHP